MSSMVFPLSEGAYTVDASKNFIPFDSTTDRIENRTASLLVDIVPFLIKTKNDLIVIDPGLGHWGNNDYQIKENILEHGFSADEVSKVLLSHLHKDHAGGSCFDRNGVFSLMFPNAKYYCQEKEMQYAIDKKNSPSYMQDQLNFLSQSPGLVYLNGNGNITHEISFEVSGGHTPYHQVFLIHSEEQLYFYGGDVLPQPSQLQRRFIAKYDFDGKRSAADRTEYGNRAAAGKWICLFFHAANMPMAMVHIENGKFLLEKW